MATPESDRTNTMTASPDGRVDIGSINVDTYAPISSRIESYLRQIGNPYAFRCGKIAVNLQFSPDGKRLEDALASYLSALREAAPPGPLQGAAEKVARADHPGAQEENHGPH